MKGLDSGTNGNGKRVLSGSTGVRNYFRSRIYWGNSRQQRTVSVLDLRQAPL